MGFAEDKMAPNAMGGTELMKHALASRMPEGLLDDFQIFISRVHEDLDPNKIKIYWHQDLPWDPAATHLKETWQQFDHIVYNSNWQADMFNKYLSKDGIKLVSKLNNKIIVQNEEVINLFTLKNESDAHRLIENLTERFVRLKRGDCMFVLDISSPQRKYLYTLLKEKGFNLDYLYRKETTY